MNTKTLLVLNVFALTSLLVLSTKVLAAEPTISFDVPVNISNYPIPNQSVSAWCEISSAQGRVVSSSYIHFPLSNGAYSGTKQVVVSYPINEAVNIKNYRCALVVEKAKGLSALKTIPSDGTILSQVNGTF